MAVLRRSPGIAKIVACRPKVDAGWFEQIQAYSCDMRSRCLLITLFSVLGFSTSFACTYAEFIDEDPDRIVMVATIVDHISAVHEGVNIFGIVVEPQAQFGPAIGKQSSTYEIFIGGGGNDCTFRYRPIAHVDTDHYRVGSVVLFEAREPRPDWLGDLMYSSLDVLAEDCSPSAVADLKPHYSGRDSVCGILDLHAYKELALLPSMSDEERFEVLYRLSQIHSFTYFKKLVDKYISSVDERQDLMELRYAQVIDRGCDSEPKVDFSADSDFREQRAFRTKWFEYCRSE